MRRQSITIYKSGIRAPYWYDEYRVDEKPYNDAYQKIINGCN